MHGKTASPLTSPNEDASSPAQASLNAILGTPSPSTHSSERVGLTATADDGPSIIREAIASQKSETPFGDLAELDLAPDAAPDMGEKRWAGDWVDFEEGDEDGARGVEDDEGEDVPIGLVIDEGGGSSDEEERGRMVGVRKARARSLLEDEED